MKFVLATMVGIFADALVSWGQRIDDWTIRVTRDACGITDEDNEQQRLEKLFDYLDNGKRPAQPQVVEASDGKTHDWSGEGD